MSLLFVDQEDFNPQQLTDALTASERLSQRLTDQANGTAAINRQMAQQLASAGHRPIRPDLQYQPPAPHPPAPSFDPNDLEVQGGFKDVPAFMPGLPPTELMRDEFIRHRPESGVA